MIRYWRVIKSHILDEESLITIFPLFTGQGLIAPLPSRLGRHSASKIYAEYEEVLFNAVQYQGRILHFNTNTN